MKETQKAADDRSHEWFVPAFGSRKFRFAVGLLFLPYTAMVLAFAAIGSTLADPVDWHRVGAIVAIYFLALGIGAHALDALGSKAVKPWGTVFSPAQLWSAATLSLTLAYAIGIYYMLRDTPLLWAIALPEGFFVFAYNLEWFGGRFHTDGWFALSWGALPVLAGYVLQTNRIGPGALLVAAAMGFLSLVEIKASRPYKALRRRDSAPDIDGLAVSERLEGMLRWLSAGVVTLAAGLIAWRILG